MAAFVVKNAQSPAAAKEHSTELRFKPADVNKAIAKQRAVVTSELKNGKFVAAIRLSGSLSTQGINSIEHDTWGTKHSFGLILNETSDEETLAEWESPGTLGEAFVWSEDRPAESDIVVNPLMKDGTIYIKCPVTKMKKPTFDFSSNVKLVPNATNPDLFRDMPVDVYVNVLAYLALPRDGEPHKWGLKMVIKHVDFWTDPAAATPTPTPTPTPSRRTTPPPDQ